MPSTTRQSDEGDRSAAILSEIDAKSRRADVLIGHGFPPDAFHDELAFVVSQDIGIKLLLRLARPYDDSAMKLPTASESVR